MRSWRREQSKLCMVQKCLLIIGNLGNGPYLICKPTRKYYKQCLRPICFPQQGLETSENQTKAKFHRKPDVLTHNSTNIDQNSYKRTSSTSPGLVEGNEPPNQESQGKEPPEQVSDFLHKRLGFPPSHSFVAPINHCYAFPYLVRDFSADSSAFNTSFTPYSISVPQGDTHSCLCNVDLKCSAH